MGSSRTRARAVSACKRSRRRPRTDPYALAACALVVAGCGSSSTTDGPGGDASSSGARAALTLNVSGDTSQGCAHFTANVPSLAGTAETVTDTTYASVVEDGRDGASVTCRVAAQGGAFDVTATVYGGPWKLVLATLVATDQSDAPATVSLTDTDLKSTWSSSPGASCALDVNGAGSSLTVAPGRLWAHVTCPTFVDPANASASCAANGWVLLDRCAQ